MSCFKKKNTRKSSIINYSDTVRNNRKINYKLKNTKQVYGNKLNLTNNNNNNTLKHIIYRPGKTIIYPVAHTICNNNFFFSYYGNHETYTTAFLEIYM